LIVEAGGDGIAKIIEKFIEMYPEVPKRQVDIKINEMAFKDKRGNDTKPTWYLKPEYENLVSSSSSSVHEKAAEKPEKAEKVEKSSKAEKAEKAEKPEKTSNKRKLEKQEDPDAGKDNRGPKKFKRAFGLYVRDYREEADHQLGDCADVSSSMVSFSFCDNVFDMI
jgi:hypothetical protein